MLAEAGGEATQLLGEPALKAALAEVHEEPLKPAGRLLGVFAAEGHLAPARAMWTHHLLKRLKPVGCCLPLPCQSGANVCRFTYKLSKPGILSARQHLAPARALSTQNLSSQLQQAGCWVYWLVGRLGSAVAVHKMSSRWCLGWGFCCGSAHTVKARWCVGWLGIWVLLWQFTSGHS